jgi:hypothetical protein
VVISALVMVASSGKPGLLVKRETQTVFGRLPLTRLAEVRR